MNNAKPKMITQSAIIEMGWTKSMINKFLPEPVQKTNPYYKCAAPMKLWDEQIVLEIMATEEYIDAKTKADKRSEAAKKAAVEKTKRLVQEVTSLANRVKIKIYSDDELIRRTIAAKNAWYDRLHEERGYECWAVSKNDVDNETLSRWIVNYIRHHLVGYDKTLATMKGKVGIYEAYPEYKRIILEKIAKAYPMFADECNRQIEEI